MPSLDDTSDSSTHHLDTRSSVEKLTETHYSTISQSMEVTAVAGQSLPTVGALSLSGIEHAHLREWILNVLQEHHAQTCEEIKRQGESLKNSFSKHIKEAEHDAFWRAIGGSSPILMPSGAVPERAPAWQADPTATSHTAVTLRSRHSNYSADSGVIPPEILRAGTSEVRNSTRSSRISTQTEVAQIVGNVSKSTQVNEESQYSQQMSRYRSIVGRLNKLGVGQRLSATMSKGASEASSRPSPRSRRASCTSFCQRICPGSSAAAREEMLFTNKNANAAAVSTQFDLLVGLVIMGNCVAMMVQLEYYGHEGQIAMGVKDQDGSWPHAKIWFKVVEHIFNAAYVLELCLRFFFLGRSFLKDKSLLFDIFLVLSTSIQLYVMEPLESSSNDDSGKPNWNLFRMMRFIRFVRVLRLVRVLKLFSALRVLVKTIISSFGALMWSMVLLFLIMIMGGLFLSELLKDFVLDVEEPLDRRKWVFDHYGTSTRSMYTLFEVTFSGCWPEYFKPLMNHVSGWYVVFVLVYISFVVFAIIRIITAIFLKETLQIAGNDAEMMVQERLKNKEAYVKKLQSVFEAVDISGDGTLCAEEFEFIVSNPMVKTWLQILELEVHDAQTLFRLLDDGDGQITYDEFLSGVLRLKGQARTMDVVSIIHSNDRISKAVDKLHTELTALPSQVRAALFTPLTSVQPPSNQNSRNGSKIVSRRSRSL